jgi:hypothetical protein
VRPAFGLSRETLFPEMSLRRLGAGRHCALRVIEKNRNNWLALRRNDMTKV